MSTRSAASVLQLCSRLRELVCVSDAEHGVQFSSYLCHACDVKVLALVAIFLEAPLRETVHPQGASLSSEAGVQELDDLPF